MVDKLGCTPRERICGKIGAVKGAGNPRAGPPSAINANTASRSGKTSRSGQATAMIHEDAQQYFVIVTGGRRFTGTPVGDEVVASALPTSGQSG